jgi:hypothetical protein
MGAMRTYQEHKSINQRFITNNGTILDIHHYFSYKAGESIALIRDVGR